MKMLQLAVCVSLVSASTSVIAGPAEEAGAVVDQWSATYSANDRDALVKLHARCASSRNNRSSCYPRDRSYP